MSTDRLVAHITLSATIRGWLNLEQSSLEITCILVHLRVSESSVVSWKEKNWSSTFPLGRPFPAHHRPQDRNRKWALPAIRRCSFPDSFSAGWLGRCSKRPWLPQTVRKRPHYRCRKRGCSQGAQWPRGPLRRTEPSPILFTLYPHLKGELSVGSWKAFEDPRLGHVYILKSRRGSVAKLQNENLRKSLLCTYRNCGTRRETQEGGQSYEGCQLH